MLNICVNFEANSQRILTFCLQFCGSKCNEKMSAKILCFQNFIHKGANKNGIGDPTYFVKTQQDIWHLIEGLHQHQWKEQ